AKLDLARAYAKKRVSAQARPLFEALIKEDPKNRDARNGLADLLLAMGDYGAAEKLLTDAKNQDPGDAGALARLGILHARMQRPDLALSELEQAVEKDPTQLEARAELGFLYLRNS